MFFDMFLDSYAHTAIIQGRDILLSIFSYSKLKSIAATLAIFAAYMVGRENFDSLFFLFVLIVIDLITGMIAAVKMGMALESRKAFKTSTKTFVYLLFFMAAFATSKIVPYASFIVLGVASFLAITEFISIAENMAKMGYALPAKLINKVKEINT